MQVRELPFINRGTAVLTLKHVIENKVVKNASWIILCKIVRAALSLVITMMTARYFGPSNFGIISYAAAIVAFAEPVMQLGLNNTLVREIINAPENEGKILGTSVFMSFLSAIACIFGIFVFSSIAEAGNTECIIVCVLYSTCLLFQAVELLQYWFWSRYLSKYTSITSLFGYFIASIYKFFLLATNKKIYWFALSNAFDFCIIAVILLLLYRKLGGSKLEISIPIGKQLLSRSHYYILSTLMVTIFAQIDKVMIKLMIGEAANGYYSASVSAANMTGFVFAAIIDSMRTAILEAHKDNREVFESRMITLYSIIIWLSLLQSLSMTILSRFIITIIYGAEYLAAVSSLRIIVWYTTFAYLGAIRNIWILAEEKQKYLWIINMCGALGNVVMNAILIPLMGIEGAAVASLLTQFFANVIMGYIIKPISPNNRLMVKGINPYYLIKASKQIFASGAER